MLNSATFLRIHKEWTVHEKTALRSAIILMAIAAGVWLSYEFWRLVWQTGYWGALDLLTMRTRTGQWVNGLDVYGKSSNAFYPPASYLLIWPLLGWLDEAPSRWFWAITTLVALGWLIYLIVRASGAETARERLFVALMPLSMYATGATIGNGQLILHLLPFLIAGVLLLRRTPTNWLNDLLSAALIVVSLVKPNVSAPFFWVVMFAPNRLRPAILAATGYLGLTVLAASFQQPSLIEQFRKWLAVNGEYVTQHGTANLAIWLGSLGLGEWILPAALLSLVALGGWVWLHRTDDLWILMGVTAVVARLWVYHFWYDDVLILLPMIALFRIVKQAESSNEVTVMAGGLLGALIVLMLAPGGLYTLPSPWDNFYQAVQVAAWLAAAFFLMSISRTTEVANVRTT